MTFYTSRDMILKPAKLRYILITIDAIKKKTKKLLPSFIKTSSENCFLLLIFVNHFNYTLFIFIKEIMIISKNWRNISREKDI